MHVHRSHRTEALLQALARVVARPLPDPLAAECIVVQGRGMERWLAHALAREHAVCAHVEFPFPQALIERVLSAVLGEEADRGAAFAPESSAWSIAELLGERLDAPGFEPIRRYLADDPGDDRRLQLAARLAETFDHYVVYRPEMVLAWERGDEAAARRFAPEGGGWQAELFRALVARHGACHLAARVRRLVRALEGTPGGLAELPQRLCVFGISTLPPLYLAVLDALARHVEVHLFVLSPSREYWADIRSRREVLRELRRRGVDREGIEAELALEEGHPLLASLGRLGRDFQQVLEGQVDYVEVEVPLEGDPRELATRPDHMLPTLQSDILALRHRGGVGSDVKPLALDPADDSILVHACHGPMREAEVLRDRLLDLFERDPGLEPRDVVVMTPDVETYGPLVEAAFAADETGGIPCRVADRSPGSAFPVIEAFGRLLDVLGGRLRASEVQDLVTTECVRARFGIDEDEADRLCAWIGESGIRWGVDAGHRVEEGQPETDQNTWRFGLDRLLLGHALGSADEGGERLFGGTLPCAAAMGGDAGGLGRLAELCEALFELRARCAEPHGVAQWCALLGELLARMLDDRGERFHEHQLVREALGALAAAGERAGYRGRPGLSAMREALDRRLAHARPSGGFLAGGVTVCELVPMRTIPFRVVALLGMSDGAFPRTRRADAFDLIRAHPRPGDRSSRDDDRQLFLEALLSARDHLIVTYVGRDVRSNEERPPSVVLGELLDHLGEAFVPGAEVAEAERARWQEDPQRWIRQRLVVEHPLQPFSARYFDGSSAALFSYGDAHCEAARALAGERRPATAFVDPPLPAPPDDDVIELDDLCEWLKDPARFLLQRRLGLWLPRDEDPVPDREPMGLEGLDRWALGDALLEDALAQAGAGDRRAVERARGVLPLGVPGRCEYDDVAREVADLAARVRGLQQHEPLPDLVFDEPLGGVRLVGVLDRLWPCGRVAHGYAKLGHRSELDLWVRHLALGWLSPPGCDAVSHLVGRPGADRRCQIRLRHRQDAREQLAGLIELYRLGRTRLLPLLPRTSRDYAHTRRTTRADDPEEQATKDAYAAWRGDGRRAAERDDPWLRVAFAGIDPLSSAYPPGGESERALGFRSLALRVFEPLLESREAVT